MNTVNLRRITVAILAVCILSGISWADKLELQAKLSSDIKIQLKDVTITEALENIGGKAGVKIVLSREAAWKLPYGEATRVSVVLDGPLADCLAEMLNAFFMRYAVGDDEITIYPREELDHILGRPSAKQLELLKAIYAKPIEVYHLDDSQETINIALSEPILITPINIGSQINVLLGQFTGTREMISTQISSSSGGRQPKVITHFVKVPKIDANEPALIGIQLQTPLTLAQLLSQISADNSPPNETTWYISGMDFQGQSPEIRILTTYEFVRLKLDQKIDISYKDESLDKIFQDLANRAGVFLLALPDSYLNEYKISIDMQNVSIRQAVINIANMVGAKCEIENMQIFISQPRKPMVSTINPEPGKKIGADDNSGYVGKISIPMDGGKYFLEFMIRESDLSDELKQLRAEKKKELLGKEEGDEEEARPTKPAPPAKSPARARAPKKSPD